MKLLSKLWQSANARLSSLRRKWNNWCWRKHRPKPLAEYEKFLLDKAPTEVLKDYLDRNKGWAGPAPMTAQVFKAELRHKLMVKKQELGLLPPPKKYIRPGTPEFEELQRKLYHLDGYHPPTKFIDDRAQS